MTAIQIDTPKALTLSQQKGAAIFAPLTAYPSSEAAKALCRKLTVLLFHQSRKPTKKQVDAFGAIAAELLERDPDDLGGWLYRSLGRSSFSGGSVGYAPFTAVFRAMQMTPMIEVHKGHRQHVQSELSGGQRFALYDQATRFRGTDWLRGLFNDAGIARDNWQDHFERKTITHRASGPSVILRKEKVRIGHETRRGATLPVRRSDPAAAAQLERMDRINDFLSKQWTCNGFVPVT